MNSTNTMTIGTSMFLIAVGAILRYAVTVKTSGFDLHVIGGILMLAGLAGAVLSFIFFATYSRRRTAVVSQPVSVVTETHEVR